MSAIVQCHPHPNPHQTPLQPGACLDFAARSNPRNREKATLPVIPTELVPIRKELGEGVGESSERVTNQNEAMIGPNPMTLRRARWIPIEKSIHTAAETTTPCQTSVTTPVRNPPSGSIRYEKSSASWRSRRQCMLADFGPNRAVDRHHDIVVKGWTAMSVRIRTNGGKVTNSGRPGG